MRKDTFSHASEVEEMVQSGPGSRADALECAVKTQSQAGEEQHRKEIVRNQRFDLDRKAVAAVAAREVVRQGGQEHIKQTAANGWAAIGAGRVSDRERGGLSMIPAKRGVYK